MDGFLFKGRELIVKEPMTTEERAALKEMREEIANGNTRPIRLLRNKPPAEEAKGLFGTAPFHKDTQGE
ncbi:hypothetical protein, conserved [Eimeria brunetti]|uniref:Uncharacterized protein n=1 Tax=Eimeria brunetti TaxID=51314 RepID=U6LYR4_9EIME|nr:hypothetical protein, conserved [Eimeria brunetti]